MLLGFIDSYTQRKIKILIKKPKSDPCNSNKSIKREIPKPYQDDFKTRMLEGREGVHSGNTLPLAFEFLCQIETPPKGHALYSIHTNK